MYKRTQRAKRVSLHVDRVDVLRLRAILKDARITQREFADACKLSRLFINLVLNGHERVGELGAIKMQRGLVALGLPQDCIMPEVCHV